MRSFEHTNVNKLQFSWRCVVQKESSVGDGMGVPNFRAESKSVSRGCICREEVELSSLN